MKTLTFLCSSLMKWGHPAGVIADPKEKAEKHKRNVTIHTCRHKPDFSSSGGGVVPLPERADVHSYRQNLFWITLCYLWPYKIVPIASHSENLEWCEKFPRKRRVLSLLPFLLDKLASEQPILLLALLTFLWLQVWVCSPVNLRQECMAVVAIFWWYDFSCPVIPSPLPSSTPSSLALLPLYLLLSPPSLSSCLLVPLLSLTLFSENLVYWLKISNPLGPQKTREGGKSCLWGF